MESSDQVRDARCGAAVHVSARLLTAGVAASITYNKWQAGGEYTQKVVLKNVQFKTMKIKYTVPTSSAFAVRRAKDVSSRRLGVDTGCALGSELPVVCMCMCLCELLVVPAYLGWIVPPTVAS